VIGSEWQILAADRRASMASSSDDLGIHQELSVAGFAGAPESL
jgi:hypothetical protein